MEGPITSSRRFEYGCEPWPMPRSTRLPQFVHRVRRNDCAPEVVIKVVSPGSNTLEAIQLHFEELPHVHMVLKAMSEGWEHLNIRKRMLHEWRKEFACHLRAQGVSAKATRPTSLRKARATKLQGIYRWRNDDKRVSTSAYAPLSTLGRPAGQK